MATQRLTHHEMQEQEFMRATPVSEDVLIQRAKICGEFSAARQALVILSRRRDAGHDVEVRQTHYGALIVGPRDAEQPSPQP